MYTLVYGIDFGNNISKNEIVILDTSEVSETVKLENDVDYIRGKEYSRLHKDGWTITAGIDGDYYLHVGKFTAQHEEYGTILGDLTKSITAESKEAFKHFIELHPFNIMDLDDI